MIFIFSVAMLTVLVSQPNKPLSNPQSFIPIMPSYDSVPVFSLTLKVGQEFWGKRVVVMKCGLVKDSCLSKSHLQRINIADLLT